MDILNMFDAFLVEAECVPMQYTVSNDAVVKAAVIGIHTCLRTFLVSAGGVG
jgi:hypothetical protein